MHERRADTIPAGVQVLDESEYDRRKAYYASVGQRHYYFMNIGNGEVIDACRKGNQARAARPVLLCVWPGLREAKGRGGGVGRRAERERHAPCRL